MKEKFTSQMVDAIKRLVSLYLWEAGAIKINLEKPFRLVSGNYSPIYINCRQLISSVSFIDLFIFSARLVLFCEHLEFDIIAGGETAGIPFAAFLARALGKPMIYVRKAEKTHGITSRIEGSIHSNAKVLLVEDLITDAGSKLSFINAIHDVRGDVKDVLVIFDRLQGGREALKSKGIQLHSLSDIEFAISVAEEVGLKSGDVLDSVREYLRSPKDWHKSRLLEYYD